MFYGCQSLNSIDLSKFVTTKVTDMNEMFEKCHKLISLDLSNFNTRNVKIMSNMFKGCYSFNINFLIQNIYIFFYFEK